MRLSCSSNKNNKLVARSVAISSNTNERARQLTTCHFALEDVAGIAGKAIQGGKVN